jgi:hypothetical protein
MYDLPASPGERPEVRHGALGSEPAASRRQISWEEIPSLEEPPALEDPPAAGFDLDGRLADIIDRACIGTVAGEEEEGAGATGAQPPIIGAGYEAGGSSTAEGASEGGSDADAEAMTLLRRVALSGFDLKLHHRERVPTLLEFAQRSYSELLYAEGRHEGVLRRLLDVSNQLQSSEQEVVGALVEAGLIREVPNGGRYECVEPRLLTLSVSSEHWPCDCPRAPTRSVYL